MDNEFELDNKSIIKSPHVICPICKEHAIFEVNNHRIKIYNCKNGHITNDILLSELEKTQLIDESKIICNKCKVKNKSNTYNKEMYICNICHMYLCPLCKSNHDKNHKIINFKDKYFICEKHNKEFYSYCETCKKDICILCTSEHKNHKNIIYSTIISDETKIKDIKLEVDYLIPSINKRFRMIISRLDNIMKNYEVYIKFIQRILENYNLNNINYNILQNITYIESNDDDLSCGIRELVKNFNIKKFCTQMFKIYDEINKNEIDLIYNIPNNKDKIKIFEDSFVKNNKDLCKIIYENKEYDLIEYCYCKKVKSNKLHIKLKGVNNVSNLEYMFRECSELSYESNFSNWDTTYVFNVDHLFSGCKFEKLPDISKFNTSNVETMDYMFYNCSNLKSLPDISTWNTSNAFAMEGIFENCFSLKSLPDLSKWDISRSLKINGIKNVFKGCSKSLIIPNNLKNIE